MLQNSLSCAFRKGHNICTCLYIPSQPIFNSDLRFKGIKGCASLFPHKNNASGQIISTICWQDSVGRKCDLCIFLYIPSLRGGFQSLSRLIPTDPVIMSHFGKLPRKIRDKGRFRRKRGERRKRQKYTHKKVSRPKSRGSDVQKKEEECRRKNYAAIVIRVSQFVICSQVPFNC